MNGVYTSFAIVFLIEYRLLSDLIKVFLCSMLKGSSLDASNWSSAADSKDWFGEMIRDQNTKLFAAKSHKMNIKVI